MGDLIDLDEEKQKRIVRMEQEDAARVAVQMCACGGTWQPALRWMARYRCDKCGIIGLKAKLVNASTDVFGRVVGHGHEQIRPYKCKHTVKDENGKRVPCGKPMTGNDVKGRHACREHRGGT